MSRPGRNLALFRIGRLLPSTGPYTSFQLFFLFINSDLTRADGVYMGFPFIAYYGAVKKNQTLLQVAYDQCRLYRDALLIDGPTGKLWAHIYDDTNSTWVDKGIWATGT